jgi:hypothetical protein
MHRVASVTEEHPTVGIIARAVQAHMLRQHVDKTLGRVHGDDTRGSGKRDSSSRTPYAMRVVSRATARWVIITGSSSG